MGNLTMLPLDYDFGSICVAFTGHRGSGKTLALTALAAEFMIGRHKQCWANYRIHFDVPEGRGKHRRIVHYESKPLDMGALMTFDAGVSDGIVLIDELQYYANSRRSMSLQNRMLDAILIQLRHRHLSFGFTVQKLEWVDNRIQWQTDLLYEMTDLLVRPFGSAYEDDDEVPTRRGQILGFIRTNMSGYLPGAIGIGRPGKLYGERYWKAYSTEEIIDALDAMTPYRLALGEKIISRSDPAQAAAVGQRLTEFVESLRSAGRDRLTTQEFWEEAGRAGITGSPRQLGQYLRPMGVRYKGGHNGTFYEIPLVPPEVGR
jgi:hypothetical protein